MGLNYSRHIEEMKSLRTDNPVIFMKPASSLLKVGQPIVRPKHGQKLHHEVEVVFLIGQEGKNISEDKVSEYIAGVTLGLDLTLRDRQSELKQKGQPWEISKSFDGSAPIGKFVEAKGLKVDEIGFSCAVNGAMRQRGNTSEMIFSVGKLVSYISSIWRLAPGDLIFTGTPAGVGEMKVGDEVEIWSPEIGKFKWKITG